MNTDALIAEARKHVSAMPSVETRERLNREIRRIDFTIDRDIVFWSHLCCQVDDPDPFNGYIAHWKAMVDKFHGADRCARVVTRQNGVDMYRRAMLMTAFVCSPAFTAPTVFMDADAFPNADLRKGFSDVKDIGMTVREIDGLMPVNEGVIFAKPTDATRAFFLAYLATYDNLAKMLQPKDWAWWGGQLSLCALADGAVGASAWPLACDHWNFAPDTEEDLTPAVLDTKAVIHMKGARKEHFARIQAYQRAR